MVLHRGLYTLQCRRAWQALNFLDIRRACAGGGPSPRSLYAPVSQGLASVASSRHRRGCARGGPAPRFLYAPMSQGLAGVALSRHPRGCAGGGPSPRCLYGPMSQGLAGVALCRGPPRSVLNKTKCRHLGSSRLNDSRRPQACPQNVHQECNRSCRPCLGLGLVMGSRLHASHAINCSGGGLRSIQICEHLCSSRLGTPRFSRQRAGVPDRRPELVVTQARQSCRPKWPWATSHLRARR